MEDGRYSRANCLLDIVDRIWLTDTLSDDGAPPSLCALALRTGIAGFGWPTAAPKQADSHRRAPPRSQGIWDPLQQTAGGRVLFDRRESATFWGGCTGCAVVTRLSPTASPSGDMPCTPEAVGFTVLAVHSTWAWRPANTDRLDGLNCSGVKGEKNLARAGGWTLCGGLHSFEGRMKPAGCGRQCRAHHIRKLWGNGQRNKALSLGGPKIALRGGGGGRRWHGRPAKEGGGVPEMGFRAGPFVLCKDGCCHQRRRNTNFGPENFFTKKFSPTNA